MNYGELERQLVRLEAFDARAFVADETTPQELCDFFLAFALAYNDFRDVILAHQLLTAVQPGDPEELTPRRGLATGLRTALIRAQCGLVHELLELVINNDTLFVHPMYRRVSQQLSRRGKEAWKAVCDVAEGRQSGDPLARALAILRNKVAFHYDVRELGRAYRSAFVEGRSHGEPLVSRGNRMIQTRFYFADAVAQVCLFERSPHEAARAFILGESNVLQALHFALYELVTKFVQSRGFAWRPGV